MVKWSRVCRSKKKGGLGVKDLHRQNVSLLCKWWWKLETQTGFWQTIVSAKYLKSKPVASLKCKTTDSPCWKALMKVRDVYLLGRRLILGNKNNLLSWGVHAHAPVDLHVSSVIQGCFRAGNSLYPLTT